MPLYTTMRAPRQQMQAEGKGAPQQGNYAGGNGMYSSRPAGGAASTKPIPGLATALGGAQAQPRPQQQGPQQTSNRAFANWGEPGSAYGPPPPPPAQPGYSISTGPVNRPTVQTAQTGAATQRPVAGLPMVMQGQQAGPPMMGPASGRMSLSGAMQGAGGNQPTHRYAARASDGSWYEVPEQQDDSGTSGGMAAGSSGGFQPGKFLSTVLSPDAVSHDVSSVPGPGAPGGGPTDAARNLGFNAGRAAGAFPAGMARALNEYTKEDLGNYYDNYEDISGLKNAGTALMDPSQQAAADAAERAQMQAGINSQRDEQLRMMMGQQGRGGMVGSGAATGLLNSALRAQALGEQNLAQDQYQRMIGREQLGGQLISDYGRQKYGLMNDAYASPGEIASLLLQATQGGVDILNKLPLSHNPFLG